MNLARRVHLVAMQVYFLPLVRGLVAALSFRGPLKFFWANTPARNVFLNCFQLNGALFLGSMLMIRCALPLVMGMVVRLVVQQTVHVSAFIVGTFASFLAADLGEAESEEDHTQELLESANWISSVILDFLWLYPLYCISFVFNATWYQEVADYALQSFSCSTKVLKAGVFQVLRDEVFRLLLVLGFVLQASLLGMVPRIGLLLQFACCSWLFSYYCFEYCWASKGWRLLRRINHFQRHWLFYLGFGAPGTVATAYFPLLVSSGVYAMVFPFFVVVGAHCHAEQQARRLKHLQAPGASGAPGAPGASFSTSSNTTSMDQLVQKFGFSMPIFWFPVRMANLLVCSVQVCCCTRWAEEVSESCK